jgi:hypothetical protein
MKATFNFKASGMVFPIKRRFLAQLGLFQENRSLLTAEEYEIRAEVPVSVVQTFVEIVEGAVEIEVSEETCEALRVLGEEFQFEALRAECAAFEALHPPVCQMEDRKLKRKSAFERQKIVESGLVRNVGSSVSLPAWDGRQFRFVSEIVFWSFGAGVSCRIREGFEFGMDLGFGISWVSTAVHCYSIFRCCSGERKFPRVQVT